MELLIERFQNKRLIIHNHVKSICEFPSISKESHHALRKLLDSIQRDLKALESMKEPVKQWSTLLTFLVSSKLDNTSRKEWEFFSIKEDTVDFDSLLKFLKQRCQILETMESSNKSNSDVNKFHKEHKYDKSKFKSQSHSFVTTIKLCPICNNNHPIYACQDFLKLPDFKRLNEVKRLKLCLNCLKPDHISKYCSWQSKCRKCDRPHNTLIHVESTAQNATHTQSNNQSQSFNNSNVQNTHAQNTHTQQVHMYNTNTQGTNMQRSGQRSSTHQASTNLVASQAQNESHDCPSTQVSCQNSSISTHSSNRSIYNQVLLSTGKRLELSWIQVPCQILLQKNYAIV